MTLLGSWFFCALVMDIFEITITQNDLYRVGMALMSLYLCSLHEDIHPCCICWGLYGCCCRHGRNSPRCRHGRRSRSCFWHVWVCSSYGRSRRNIFRHKNRKKGNYIRGTVAGFAVLVCDLIVVAVGVNKMADTSVRVDTSKSVWPFHRFSRQHRCLSHQHRCLSRQHRRFCRQHRCFCRHHRRSCRLNQYFSNGWRCPWCPCSRHDRYSHCRRCWTCIALANFVLNSFSAHATCQSIKLLRSQDFI